MRFHFSANIMGPYLDSDPETGEPKNVDNNFRCGTDTFVQIYLDGGIQKNNVRAQIMCFPMS